MNDTSLNGHHRATLESIFRHPVGHNIEWHDVVSLLERVGSVTEESNGRYLVSVGGHNVVVHSPRHHDIDVQQVLDLRRLLEEAGVTPASVH